MSIEELLPWWRKRTESKVPIRVREERPEISDPDVSQGTDACEPWRGLTPLGVLGDQCSLLGPRMDIVEDGRVFTVTVEVPGTDEDDIGVALGGERLITRGQRAEGGEVRGHGRYELRRSQKSFRRSVVLTCPIDVDRANARLSHGLLTITLPKGEASGGSQLGLFRRDG